MHWQGWLDVVSMATFSRNLYYFYHKEFSVFLFLPSLLLTCWWCTQTLSVCGGNRKETQRHREGFIIIISVWQQIWMKSCFQIQNKPWISSWNHLEGIYVRTQISKSVAPDILRNLPPPPIRKMPGDTESDQTPIRIQISHDERGIRHVEDKPVPECDSPGDFLFGLCFPLREQEVPRSHLSAAPRL